MSRNTFGQRRALPGRLVFTSLVLLGLNTLSHGQTNGDTDSQESNNIDEIVVTSRFTTNERLDTATGLGLTLMETPQSVSVMTEQRVEDQDLRTLTDVVDNAPGVSAQARDSSRHAYSSRGFDIDNYQIDGIPMIWSSGGDAGETQTHTALYQRVEVVRGATGLLTGAGNPSASINLVRKHANSEVLTGSVDVSTGRWDNYSVTADVGSRLNSNGSVRGRTVVNYEDGDSFRDLAGDTTRVFYGVVDADITDNLLLRVGASYQDNDPTASTWGGLPTWFSDGTRTDWDRSKTIGTDWSSWASEVQNQFADVIYSFDNGWELKFNANRNLNEADLLLLYISGTVDRDSGLGLNPSPYNAETERDQISYSFQASGTYPLFGRDHEITVGAIDSQQDFISKRHSRSNVAPIDNFFRWDGNYPQPDWGPASVNTKLDTEQTGIYAATRLTVTDRLKFIIGSRLADWEQTGRNWSGNISVSNDNVLVPYTGALYDITDNHTVYASYTEIFQPQSVLDRSGDSLGPIEGKNREVGLKSRFFNDALHTTVTVFSVLEDNLAQPDGAPVEINGEPVQFYRGAEGAESEGYELEIVGELMAGWDLSFSYTNFEAEDANGNPVNTEHPRELLKLYTTYQFAGALEHLTVAGGVNWEGRNYTDATNPITGQPERLEQDSFSLVNLMMRYNFSPNLTGQLNIDNLLDEEYYSQIGFYSQLEFGQPRNITASFTYDF